MPKNMKLPGLEGLIVGSNQAENYGITGKLFEEFRMGSGRHRGRDNEYDIRFTALKRIFHGMYNLDISHEMYQFLNPLEILALEYGAGKVKEKGQPSIQYESFPETVSKLVGLAFKYYPAIFGRAQHSLEHPHSIEKGALLERMRTFERAYPGQSKQFLNYFYNRFVSTRNIDPNRDGYSINLYIQNIKWFAAKDYKAKSM